MYCTIIGTRVNHNAGGMCYDLFTCESKENALKKLNEYHKSFCEGYLTCINCNFDDKELVIDNLHWSPCKTLCDVCKNDPNKVNEMCNECTYCDNCENCTVYKCNNECEKVCYKCEYNGTLANFIIGDTKCTKNSYYCSKNKCSYEKCTEDHYLDDRVKVQIYYLDKELECWRNNC